MTNGTNGFIDLSESELINQIATARAALEQKRATRKAAFLSGLLAQATDVGASADEVIRALKHAPAHGRAGVAKYRSPSDDSKTWSGFGRPPRWFDESIAAGLTREQMAIR